MNSCLLSEWRKVFKAETEDRIWPPKERCVQVAEGQGRQSEIKRKRQPEKLEIKTLKGLHDMLKKGVSLPVLGCTE